MGKLVKSFVVVFSCFISLVISSCSCKIDVPINELKYYLPDTTFKWGGWWEHPFSHEAYYAKNNDKITLSLKLSKGKFSQFFYIKINATISEIICNDKQLLDEHITYIDYGNGNLDAVINYRFDTDTLKLEFKLIDDRFVGVDAVGVAVSIINMPLTESEDLGIRFKEV